jgi:hypothetical protein
VTRISKTLGLLSRLDGGDWASRWLRAKLQQSYTLADPALCPLWVEFSKSFSWRRVLDKDGVGRI